MFSGFVVLLRVSLIMCGLLGAVITAAVAEEPVPSFIDTPTPVPEPPSEKQIKKAVMRCLSSVDSAISALRRNPRGLGAAEEGEERYCFDQKKECLKDPGSFACRSFIQDYVAE